MGQGAKTDESNNRIVQKQNNAWLKKSKKSKLKQDKLQAAKVKFKSIKGSG